MQCSTASGERSLWLLGLLLVLNAVLLAAGTTEDAFTLGTRITKSLLGVEIPVVDERVTYSILSGILQLWKEGNRVFFVLVFTFSVVFPWVKLIGNMIIWALMMLSVQEHDVARLGRIAGVLQILALYSMLEVFAAGLMCLLSKLGDMIRVIYHPGLFLFIGAVILSSLCAWMAKGLAKGMANS